MLKTQGPKLLDETEPVKCIKTQGKKTLKSVNVVSNSIHYLLMGHKIKC